MRNPAGGYRRKHGQGRELGVYADVPIRRSCACPEPVVYRDEDDDLLCFRCGQLVGSPVARVV